VPKDWNQANMIAMVASLQQRLDHIITGEREHSFISHSLRLLSTLSGRQVHLEKWTITAYDIEYVRKIGSGRLYVHFYYRRRNVHGVGQWRCVRRHMEQDPSRT
jgi:hypothetical protein